MSVDLPAARTLSRSMVEHVLTRIVIDVRQKEVLRFRKDLQYQRVKDTETPTKRHQARVDS